MSVSEETFFREFQKLHAIHNRKANDLTGEGWYETVQWWTEPVFIDACRALRFEDHLPGLGKLQDKYYSLKGGNGAADDKPFCGWCEDGMVVYRKKIDGYEAQPYAADCKLCRPNSRNAINPKEKLLDYIHDTRNHADDPLLTGPEVKQLSGEWRKKMGLPAPNAEREAMRARIKQRDKARELEDRNE